jgi:hypothetical protein
VLPLHATIQEHARSLGFDTLAPIIWYKIGNTSLESGGNARFLGKPYEPGAVVEKRHRIRPPVSQARRVS